MLIHLAHAGVDFCETSHTTHTKGRLFSRSLTNGYKKLCGRFDDEYSILSALETLYAMFDCEEKKQTAENYLAELLQYQKNLAKTYGLLGQLRTEIEKLMFSLKMYTFCFLSFFIYV